MTQVLVVYASDYGNTEKMAGAVAEGVNLVDGVNAVVKKAEDVSAEDMTSSDGVIIGSPVFIPGLQIIFYENGGLLVKFILKKLIIKIFGIMNIPIVITQRQQLAVLI